MAWYDNFENWIGMGNKSNPANAAQPYLNQLPGMMQQQYNPYIQGGMGELPNLQQQYGAMTNPNFINQMGQNFQQSPGYQFGVNQATNAANRAAAAGGMAGSPQEQQNLAGSITGMANQDYYNWMNHAMGAYGAGVQGEHQLYDTGFNASNELANNLGSIGESQANLAYAGQQNQNQMRGGMFGAGLGLLGSVAGGLMGGPFGAMAGGSLGRMFGGMGQGGQGGQGASNDWGPMAW